MDMNTARELVKARKDVENKYRALRTDVTAYESLLERQYEPITKQLKRLIPSRTMDEEKKGEPERKRLAVDKSMFGSSDDDDDDDDETISSIGEKEDKDDEEQNKQEEYEEEEEKEEQQKDDDVHVVIKEESTDKQKLGKEIIGGPESQKFLSELPDTARDYFERMFEDVKPFDKQYGVHWNKKQGGFYVGDSPIYFKRRDILIGDGEGTKGRFATTPGLYELLFMKECTNYTEEDRKMYGKIVKATNANRARYDSKGPVAGNRSNKYQSVVQHLFEEQGSGIKLTGRRVEYVPWNDPNKLVDRLRVLHASRVAGHGGHANEITYIIDELRRSHYVQ